MAQIPPLARTTLTLTVVLIGVYIALDILAQLLPPHYNAVTQAESDLAVGPYGYVMTVNFVVRGLLSTSFLVGLTAATRIGSRSRAGVALLSVWAVGALLLAIFPTDIGTTEATVHGRLHLVLALVAFVGATIGMALLSRHFLEEDRLRAFTSPANVISTLTILSFVIFLLATPVPFLLTHAYGLLERIFIGLVLLWMLTVSLHLLRSRQPAERPIPEGT
ncbi:MAG: DUF998 domain-containing protein [Thermoplasmata archaeon]